jgi:hypothetical protein
VQILKAIARNEYWELEIAGGRSYDKELVQGK